MTNFTHGDMVSARKYVVERHPEYAERVGHVVGTRSVGRKNLVDVEWLGGIAQVEWPGSYLKLVTGGLAASARRAFVASRQAERDGISSSDSDGEYDPGTIPQPPRGELLDTSGFVSPETLSDDVRAGRVTLELVDETQLHLGDAVVQVDDVSETATVTLDDQEVTVNGEGDEVKVQLTEPTYGPCNGYRCGCDDWTLGKKVGGLAVCATCTHTQNTHKVLGQHHAAKRGSI